MPIPPLGILNFVICRLARVPECARASCDMPAALLLVVVLAGTTCELNPLEPRFRAALQKLLTLLPPGNLVDSGSNSGGESCWLANQLPSRKVHAVDPTPARLNAMMAAYGALKNVVPLHALRMAAPPPVP